MFENISMMLKLRSAWSTFSSNHPGVAGFISQAGKRGVEEGSIIDVKITYPDGTHLETNMRVTASDLELMQTLKEIAAQKNK